MRISSANWQIKLRERERHTHTHTHIELLLWSSFPPFLQIMNVSRRWKDHASTRIQFFQQFFENFEDVSFRFTQVSKIEFAVTSRLSCGCSGGRETTFCFCQTISASSYMKCKKQNSSLGIQGISNQGLRWEVAALDHCANGGHVSEI